MNRLSTDIVPRTRNSGPPLKPWKSKRGPAGLPTKSPVSRSSIRPPRSRWQRKETVYRRNHVPERGIVERIGRSFILSIYSLRFSPPQSPPYPAPNVTYLTSSDEAHTDASIQPCNRA